MSELDQFGVFGVIIIYKTLSKHVLAYIVKESKLK